MMDESLYESSLRGPPCGPVAVGWASQSLDPPYERKAYLLRFWEDIVSQIRTVLSPEPETNRVPSWLKAIE